MGGVFEKKTEPMENKKYNRLFDSSSRKPSEYNVQRKMRKKKFFFGDFSLIHFYLVRNQQK